MFLLCWKLFLRRNLLHECRRVYWPPQSVLDIVACIPSARLNSNSSLFMVMRYESNPVSIGRCCIAVLLSDNTGTLLTDSNTLCIVLKKIHMVEAKILAKSFLSLILYFCCVISAFLYSDCVRLWCKLKLCRSIVHILSVNKAYKMAFTWN